MQVKIDDTLCTGCEVCVDICSEVFEMADDCVVAKVNPVPACKHTASPLRTVATSELVVPRSIPIATRC